jgi:hypothetical protein
VVAEVVDRLDEPAPQEVAPHPIDEGLGEDVVVRAGDEIRQRLPPVDVLALADLAAVQEGRERDADRPVAAVEGRVRLGRLVGQLDVIDDLGAGGVGDLDLPRADPLEEGVDPQKSACFQSLDGWSWHCVHWICWPRKTRVLMEVSGTAPNSMCDSAKLTAPFSLFDPSAVSSSRATSFQGRLPANCSRSQDPQRVAVDHALPVPPPDQVDCPDVAEVLRVIGVGQQVLDQLGPLAGVLALQERQGFRTVGSGPGRRDRPVAGTRRRRPAATA